MGLIEKSVLERWEEAKIEAMHDTDNYRVQECCCVNFSNHTSFDVIKLLESWQEKIKSENPDYSEKEISAYLAGMIRGIGLQKETIQNFTLVRR